MVQENYTFKHEIDKTLQPVQCNICDMKLKNIDILKRHKESIHFNTEIDKNLSPVQCNICRLKLRNMDSVTLHKQEFHERQKCNLCNYESFGSKNMKYHMKGIHMIDKPSGRANTPPAPFKRTGQTKFVTNARRADLPTDSGHFS